MNNLKRAILSAAFLSGLILPAASIAASDRKDAAHGADRKSGITKCWEVAGAGPMNSDKVLRCGKRVEEPTCARGGKETGEPAACGGSVVPAVLRIVRSRTQYRLKV